MKYSIQALAEELKAVQSQLAGTVDEKEIEILERWVKDLTGAISILRSEKYLHRDER